MKPIDRTPHTPSPWMTTQEAAEYTRRPTRAAFRIWARRRGIVPVDGLVSRYDIDAVLTRLRARRRVA